MLRILRILFISLAVLVVAGFIGVIIFLKTLDADRFRRDIMAQINENTGRKADVQDVSFDFSLRKGVILNIKGVSIANEEGVEPAQLLDVKRMRLDLDFMAFLTKRKILVSNINLITPKLTIIRDASQRVNVQELVKMDKSPAAVAGDGKVPSRQSDTKPADVPAFLSALHIKKVTVTEAQVLFIDRAMSPEASARVAAINIAIDDFSFTDPFTFEVDAGIFHILQNTRIKGRAKIDLDAHQVTLTDMGASVDIGAMDEWRSLIGWLPQLSVIDRIKGKVNVAVRELSAGAQGLVRLEGSGTLNEGRVGIGPLNSLMDSCEGNFSFTEKIVDVSGITCGFLSGTVQVSGKMQDYLIQGPLSATLDVAGVSLAQLAESVRSPIYVSGSYNMRVALSAENTDPRMVQSSMLGQSDFGVVDGRIRDINILKIFLDGLFMIPNVEEKLRASLPEKYKIVMEQGGTVFEQLEGKTVIKDGRAEIARVDIFAPGFRLDINGYYELTGMVAISGGLVFVKDLSVGLVAAVPELSSLLDRNQEIYIPMLPYSGPVAELKVAPDTKYLLQKVVVGRGRQEIEKLIDKALGNEDEQVQGEGAPSSEPSLEKEIIGNILDSIFGSQ